MRRPGWLSEMVWEESAYRYRHPVDWATGAALFSSRQQLTVPSDLGMSDSFSTRRRLTTQPGRVRQGIASTTSRAARVHHRGGGSGRSDKLTALMAVNRVRYMEKRRSRASGFRLAVILHELLRATKPGHRAALQAVLRRATWSELTRSFGASPAGGLNGIGGGRPDSDWLGGLNAYDWIDATHELADGSRK